MTSAPSAVVTGAGSGIGRSVARILLAHGWRVALAGRTRDSLRETAGESDLALTVPADVTDPDSVRGLFEAVTTTFGRLDLLINNAGTVGPQGPVDEISYHDWSQAIATNVTSRMAHGVPQADGRILPEPTFDPEHVARAVLFMAELPLDTNVQFLTITATKMPFIGRG